jgi:hypothetical protein
VARLDLERLFEIPATIIDNQIVDNETIRF